MRGHHPGGLTTGDLHGLFAWLEAQPSWSDLPLIVLTERGGGPERNPGALRLIEALGNVTLLERPFHPSTFLSHVQYRLITAAMLALCGSAPNWKRCCSAKLLCARARSGSVHWRRTFRC